MNLLKIGFKKNNLTVLAVCLFVGLFSIVPSISPFFNMGQKFAYVWPELNGDRLYYFARIQEVTDGHPEINHPYFYEHKDDVYPQATGAERAMAFINRLMGLRIYNLQVFFDFASPFLVALLTYILLTALGIRRRFALLTPLLLLTTISGPLLKPIHPAISMSLLLMFFVFWAKLVLPDVVSDGKKIHKKIIYSILSGVLLGLLFLTYFCGCNEYKWPLFSPLLIWKPENRIQKCKKGKNAKTICHRISKKSEIQPHSAANKSVTSDI